MSSSTDMTDPARIPIYRADASSWVNVDPDRARRMLALLEAANVSADIVSGRVRVFGDAADCHAVLVMALAATEVAP